jgi:hypothetical protein
MAEDVILKASEVLAALKTKEEIDTTRTRLESLQQALKLGLIDFNDSASYIITVENYKNRYFGEEAPFEALRGFVEGKIILQVEANDEAGINIVVADKTGKLYRVSTNGDIFNGSPCVSVYTAINDSGNYSHRKRKNRFFKR